MTKLHYLATILISTALGYSIAKYQIHRNKKKEL